MNCRWALSVGSVLTALGPGAQATEIFSTPPSTWPAGGDTRSLAIGDLDGDGLLDIVVTNTAYGTYSILVNQGDGSFSAPLTAWAGDEEPRDVLLGAFDGTDGIDMVIPCTGDLDSGWTQIFFNTGFGFSHHQTLGGGDGPWHCLVDDFDDQVGLDVVLTYPWSGTLGVLHNDGAGNFNVTISPLTDHPIQLDKADLDLDGDLDIVFTQSQPPLAYGLCSARNDGQGHFLLGAKYSISDPTGGIAAADFNGDGYPDVALGVNAGPANDNLRVYFTRPQGGFHPPQYYGDLAHGLGVVAADFDLDGDADIAICGLYLDYLAILHNDGAGEFTTRELHATAAGPYRIRVADINADGLPDLAVACLEAGVVQIFLNAWPTAADVAPSGPAGILGIQPNPFNPSGVVRYRNAREGMVELTVYDAHGRRVRSLSREWQAAGEHAVTWNGLDDAGAPTASGVYLIEFVGPAVRDARKATLLK